MLITLLAWLYISFICLVWGNLFLRATAKPSGMISGIELPVICMTGLSVIGTIALYLSIIMPLDWRTHIIILIPVLIYCLWRNNRSHLKKQLSILFGFFSSKGICFLIACLIMVLVISSYVIKHPDTLNYHGQAIEWFKKFKAVPGIVHLKLELGFQSLWFSSEAILHPDIFDLHPSFFLGGTVLCWYFIFVISKIDSLLKKNIPRQGNQIGWILLLIYTIVSWTQVRLTAASASPDFIVTLYILAAVYIFARYKMDLPWDHQYLSILILFCCTAVSIKLSSVALLLLPIIIIIFFYRQHNYRGILVILVLLVIVISPVLIRNIIATGYPLYPSSSIDIFHVDWKLEKNDLVNFQHYITAYARFPIDNTASEKTLQLQFFTWISLWWERLVWADRLLLCSIVLATMQALIFLKSYISKIRRNDLIVFLVALTGSILWFISAPDPRFGTGFLICLVYILCSPLKEKFDNIFNKIKINISKGAVIFLFFAIISYVAYRFSVFFKPNQIFFPAGVEKVGYKEFYCEKIKLNICTEGGEYKYLPIPCAPDKCVTFIPRGETITDGFKKR